MESKGQPLKEYIKGEIYYGIKTGLNEAFVINREMRNRLIAEDKRSAEIIKPFLSGNEVRRYDVRFADNYLIWTFVGVDIKKYPAIFRHLEQVQTKAEKRWDKGNHWWELRHCAYYEKFEKPKIIYPIISTQPRFSFDENKFYGNDKVFFLAVNDFYLLGVLNSQSVFD